MESRVCEKTGTWDTAGYVVFVNYVDGTGPTVDPPSQPLWRTEVEVLVSTVGLSTVPVGQRQCHHYLDS